MDASMAQKIVFYQMVGHHPAGSVGGRLWPPKAPRKRQLWRCHGHRAVNNLIAQRPRRSTWQTKQPTYPALVQHRTTGETRDEP
jgi:hypothetical protein